MNADDLGRASGAGRMPCLACSRPSPRGICARCHGNLSVAPERVAGGVLVRAAFVHEGVARTLVHRLKYQASPRAAPILARCLAGLLPGDASALVPVPRVIARRWRYGVDPSRELARALGRLTGLPVVSALRPALWIARRAGGAGRPRGSPRFAAAGAAPPRSVLVDDVVTTGVTLAAARAVSGVSRAVTVTSAAHPSSDER